MGLVANGTTIAVSTSPNANGTAITKIVANGTTVWEKSTVKWTNIWSGTLYLSPTDDEIDNIIYGTDTEGAVSCSVIYSGMTNSFTSSDVLRGTGSWTTLYVSRDTGDTGYTTNGSLTHSSSATTTNFPWNDYGSNNESITVNKPTMSGTAAIQTATLYWGYRAGYVFIPFVEMTNLYKKG